MNIFTKARVGISNYLVKKQQKKLNRQIEVCNIQKAKNALVVCNTSTEDGVKALKIMKVFLSDHSINCDVIGYSNNKNGSDLISDSKHHYLSNDHFTFFYLPKPLEVKTLVNKEHDLLVNLCDTYSNQVENMVKLSKAKFKVGCSNFRTDTHDLLLEIAETQTDPLYITKQMQHYITIINS